MKQNNEVYAISKILLVFNYTDLSHRDPGIVCVWANLKVTDNN
jgi:hypothetical protein